MIITLLGVYIVIVGLMTWTLFQDHRCVRNINFKVLFCIIVCCLNVLWLLHTLKWLGTIWFVWFWFIFKEISNMFFISRVAWLFENYDILFHSDTINVINVKHCMIVQTEFYLFISLPVILTLFQGHSCVKQFQPKLLCSYLIKLKLCRIVR